MKNSLHNIRQFLETDSAMWLLVAFAFLLRVTGIGYGLPLTVVADEPPFILAALQMLQLHTLIPAFHMTAFTSILYYPPYLSYLYLLPFTAVTAVCYLFWHGALFSAYLISDLSAFFITARLISVILGTFSVYLVYRVAQALFASRIAAAIAGFLLATSLIHESLSMVGRHWLSISFIFVLILCVLTRENLPENRRIFYAFLIAGIGVGVSTFTVVALIPLVLWFFLLNKIPFRAAVRDTWVLRGILVFLILVPLPSLLYPHSQGAIGGVLLLHGTTTLTGFVISPLQALLPYAYSEPVLILLFLIGMGALWFRSRQWFFVFGVFFLFYVFLFYILAAFEYRFFLPLVPVYALIGGYAGYLMTKTKTTVVFLFVLLLIPLAGAVRLSTLAYQGDTRETARSWMLDTLRPSDKILVYGDLLRLPVNQETVAELRAIDSTAVRKTDEGEVLLNRTNIPHALNLYTVKNVQFLHSLALYARERKYDYVLYRVGGTGDASTTAQLNELTEHAQLIRIWEGLGDSLSIAGSQFAAPLPLLFSGKSFGPTLLLYKLR